MNDLQYVFSFVLKILNTKIYFGSFGFTFTQLFIAFGILGIVLLAIKHLFE